MPAGRRDQRLRCRRPKHGTWLATVEAPFFQYVWTLIRAEINQIAGAVALRTGTP
jgi:hypothetical protein